MPADLETSSPVLTDPVTVEPAQNKVRESKVRARRIDTMSANKWEAIVDGRPVGRAARKETALKIAQTHAARHPTTKD